MSYYLFLDDIRMPEDVTWVKLPKNVEWEIVRDYKEFIKTIWDKGIPKFVAFDHDLGPNSYSECFDSSKNGYINYKNIKEMTGLDCTNWLINYCIKKNLPFPEYMVHSMNPIGKSNIISLIKSYKKITNNSV